MITRPLIITIQNPDGVLFYVCMAVLTAIAIWLMVRTDARRANPSGKRCRVCGGRVVITHTGAVIHNGDAELVSRQLPHSAELVHGGAR